MSAIKWIERRDAEERKVTIGIVQGREYLRLHGYRGRIVASHRGTGSRWTYFCQAPRGPYKAAPFRAWYSLDAAKRAMEKIMAGVLSVTDADGSSAATATNEKGKER